jgi:hypothetical protein
MDGILVSQKYGVNPSMQICAWCGEAMGILMLGRLKDDAEAPRQMVTSYEPCGKCKEAWSQGVCIAETTFSCTQKERPSISEHEGRKLYPTGRIAVVTKEFFNEIFNGLKPGKDNMALMPSEDFSEFFKEAFNK